MLLRKSSASGKDSSLFEEDGQEGRPEVIKVYKNKSQEVTELEKETREIIEELIPGIWEQMEASEQNLVLQTLVSYRLRLIQVQKEFNLEKFSDEEAKKESDKILDKARAEDLYQENFVFELMIKLLALGEEEISVENSKLVSEFAKKFGLDENIARSKLVVIAEKVLPIIFFVIALLGTVGTKNIEAESGSQPMEWVIMDNGEFCARSIFKNQQFEDIAQKAKEMMRQIQIRREAAGECEVINLRAIEAALNDSVTIFVRHQDLLARLKPQMERLITEIKERQKKEKK